MSANRVNPAQGNGRYLNDEAHMAGTFTTSDVGRMCGVDSTTVVRWIQDGRLEAYATPGGHRRIAADALRRFLDAYHMPVPPDVRRAHPTRVLIVDDEAAVVEVVSRALRLEDPDLEIETAADGFEACLKAGAFLPDLVMLDLVLPGMDGPRVCAAVRSMPALSRTRVVAMTGFPDHERVEQTLAAGAERCLTKPLRIEELQALVRAPQAASAARSGGAS
jgi:excisionase family DNA binding protein